VLRLFGEAVSGAGAEAENGVGLEKHTVELGGSLTEQQWSSE